MLVHVTTGLSWPVKADTWVVAKSVSASDQDGRNDQFWDKRETIGSGEGRTGRGEEGNKKQIRRRKSNAREILVTQLLDSEIRAHSVSNTCTYTAQSEMVIQVAPAGKRVVGWLVGAGESGV